MMSIEGYDHSRWLSLDEAVELGYRVEHALPDGRVRSMATSDGYLVVYGAPSYMHAAWRAHKAALPPKAHQPDLGRG